ncbi:MAG: hypothetical protein ACD_21C00054G0003 [uncultured bacterium]|nr:MAG: hypothetical protein ACD_21C00054G0003 [uncultured bacterium]HBS51874.1 hypothetical protein [Coxiellaceae bacterium]
MKKLLPIVLVAASFALIGCSAEKTTSTVAGTGYDQPKEKCYGKKCYRHGKLGVEKTTKDTAK